MTKTQQYYDQHYFPINNVPVTVIHKPLQTRTCSCW